MGNGHRYDWLTSLQKYQCFKNIIHLKALSHRLLTVFDVATVRSNTAGFVFQQMFVCELSITLCRLQNHLQSNAPNQHIILRRNPGHNKK